jgi:hypothetical protein
VKWGGITCAVVFPVGKYDQTPHPRSLKGFARMWLTHPMPVTGHGLLPDQNTACPGPFLREWIATEGWIAALGVQRFGRRNYTVAALRKRLYDLGYFRKDKGKFYSQGVKAAVKAFQTQVGLPADGVCRDTTFRALGYT